MISGDAYQFLLGRALHKIKIVAIIIIIASVDLKGTHIEPMVWLYMTNSSSNCIITTRILILHIKYKIMHSSCYGSLLQALNYKEKNTYQLLFIIHTFTGGGKEAM